MLLSVHNGASRLLTSSGFQCPISSLPSFVFSLLLSTGMSAFLSRPMVYV